MEHVMGGFRIPGPQCYPDPSIEDGTLALAKSPTPGPVCVTKLDSQSKDRDLPATQQIYVFFFGGYKSSQPNVNDWSNSAQKQRSDVTFNAFPYPDDTPADPPDNVLDKFRSVIESIKNTKADKIFVVGHSSGCAIANGVARRLKDNDKIVLVALDGFLPDAKQLKRPSTQVWGAVSGNAKSFHYDDMKSGGKEKFHEFTANPDCTTKVALHFSLVNTAANDKDIKDFHDLKNGYKACVANLCWL